MPILVARTDIPGHVGHQVHVNDANRWHTDYHCLDCGRSWRVRACIS